MGSPAYVSMLSKNETELTSSSTQRSSAVCTMSAVAPQVVEQPRQPLADARHPVEGAIAAHEIGLHPDIDDSVPAAFQARRIDRTRRSISSRMAARLGAR
jgi:hypothetical protein